jgi:hypothetical protein
LHLGGNFNKDISSLENIILSSKVYEIDHYNKNLKEMYNNYIKKWIINDKNNFEFWFIINTPFNNLD